MQSVVAAALVVVVVAAAAAATTAEVTVMELTECQTYLLGILMLSF
jgi:hypothetical protein